MTRRRTIVGVLLPVAILVAGVGASAGLVLSKPKPATKAVEERTWLVRSETVMLGDNLPGLRLYGRVQSPSEVTLTAAIEADVTKVLVRAGDKVEAGQVVVELDDREARFRLRQRQAELSEIDALIKGEKERHANDSVALEHEQELLRLAEKGVERARQLQRRSLGTPSQLDEALEIKARQELAVANRRYAVVEHPERLAQLEARRDQAAAGLELAGLDRERTRVRAPFAGRITSTPAAAGKRARVGENLVALYDPSALEVRAQLPMQLMRDLRVAMENGQPLLGQSHIDGVEVQLVLERFASLVEAGRGGVDGFFRVEQGESVLQIGRVLDLILALPAVSRTITLPREGLYGTDRVYKIVEERLVAVPVTVVGEVAQERPSGRLVIQSPELADGDKVLVTKFANAMEGLRVTLGQEAR